MGGKQLLLLVSQTQPDLRTLAAQFGVPGQAWETRPYRPLLDQITPGSIWRFRLVADPTKSCQEPTQPQKGFVRTCGSVPQQARWLLDRAQKHGFQLTENSFAVTGNKWYLFRKGTTHDSVSLLAVTYEGLLQVTDAEAFRTTLCQGIGHGKAYGMGLLTVIRAQEQGLCASGHSADTTR
ncbi:MAG: type I-E CRISPR-associated protein Cas6/Cse3/CasE [Eubacteriales bacterium]|nr:type I-E CRISPR-associated protein Cas6/Cse3/CasE [Eubacteriales bacterium]